MKTEPYKDEIGAWIYAELPDTVRPATVDDLFTPSGSLNRGKQFLCYSNVYEAFITSKIYESTTVDDVDLMLRDKVIYVKK